MKTNKHKTLIQDEKEVYILKIYRRSDEPSKSLVGTIEDIRGKKKGIFKTEKALLLWLLEQRGM
jgi:hypothetical protein